MVRHTIAKILAFENSKKVLTQQQLHIFLIFKYQYLSNGKSDGNKPIHICTHQGLPDKDVSKNIQMEANYVIFKMTEFATFINNMQNKDD